MLFLSIFFYSFNARAINGIINDIKITGIQRIDNETIKMYGNFTIGEKISDESISDGIKRLYETEYFSEIKINFENGVLFIELKENPIINDIFIDGSKLFKYEQIKNELETTSRSSYTRSKLKNDSDKIKTIYQKYGMMSVYVEPKVVFLDGNRVDVVFEIEEGEQSKVGSVKFYGNEKINSLKLKDLMNLKEKNPINPFSKGAKYEQDKFEIDKDNIVKFYKSNGYIDMEIEKTSQQFSRDSDIVMLNLYIKEGIQYKISGTKISNSIDGVDFKFNSAHNIGDYYSEKNSKDDIKYIDDVLYKEGYGYAKVKEIIHKNNDFVEIEYLITDDDLYLIKDIKIVGNNKTKDYIIRRELLFSEGSILIKKDIERSRNRLRSLGYFKNIDIKEIKTNNKNVEIEIKLEEETRRGMINLSAGYSSFEGKVLSVGFSRYNIFGKGYDLMTDFSYSKISEGFSFGISTARFGYTKLGGGIDFGFSKFDARPYGVSYYSQSKYISPNIMYRLGDNLFHTISYTYRVDDMHQDQNASTSYLRTILLDQFKYIKTSLVTNGIFYDTRDNFILPNIGKRLGFSETIAGLGGNQKFLRHDFEASIYKTWFDEGSPFVLSLKGGKIQGFGSEDVLFQNRYAVWYYNMRGFGYGGIGPRLVETKKNGSKYVDYISYRGNNYGILTIEQHFPFPNGKEIGGRWYLFSDFATLWGFDGDSKRINSLGNTEEIVQSRSIRNATGVGLAFATPFGLIKLDYSYKIQKEQYDSTQKFRISLGNMPLN